MFVFLFLIKDRHGYFLVWTQHYNQVVCMKNISNNSSRDKNKISEYIKIYDSLLSSLFALGNNVITKKKENENIKINFKGHIFLYLIYLDSLIFCCLHDLFNPASYSLYINCGGNHEQVNGTSYEDDHDSSGPARFHVSSNEKWAFSTTGAFLDSHVLRESYSPQNISKLTMVDAELYTDARVSPISLTYYGFCLANGNYTVNLHFAEIMFTEDQTYASLGRRVFDIYLQVHGLTIKILINCNHTEALRRL